MLVSSPSPSHRLYTNLLAWATKVLVYLVSFCAGIMFRMGYFSKPPDSIYATDASERLRRTFGFTHKNFFVSFGCTRPMKPSLLDSLLDASVCRMGSEDGCIPRTEVALFLAWVWHRSCITRFLTWTISGFQVTATDIICTL